MGIWAQHACIILWPTNIYQSLSQLMCYDPYKCMFVRWSNIYTIRSHNNLTQPEGENNYHAHIPGEGI